MCCCDERCAGNVVATVGFVVIKADPATAFRHVLDNRPI